MVVAMLLPMAALAHVLSMPHASWHVASRVGCRVPWVMAKEDVEVVPIKVKEPQPNLTPREVIDAVHAGLHRSNWDTPTPFYGFGVALRFLAPTHPAKRAQAKPAGYSRFMRQPHKVEQTLWSEYKYDGEVIFLKDDDGMEEAYQMVSMRSGPEAKWETVRWKLVRVEVDLGDAVRTQWMVEAVFGNEPDTATDIEFLAPPEDAAPDDEVLDWNGVLVPLESPQQVVLKVMSALRKMDEPTKYHGAVVATRYCSPLNRAAELSPQVFASYLEEPGYAPLVTWDEIQPEDEEIDEDTPNLADVEVLVKQTDVCPAGRAARSNPRDACRATLRACAHTVAAAHLTCALAPCCVHRTTRSRSSRGSSRSTRANGSSTRSTSSERKAGAHHVHANGRQRGSYYVRCDLVWACGDGARCDVTRRASRESGRVAVCTVVSRTVETLECLFAHGECCVARA